MKEIPLSRGLVALVDEADFDRLRAFRWCATSRRYAYRHEQVNGKQTGYAMHREIMGLSKDDPHEVDHIDGNPLNNQRCNLRVCSHAENTQNKRKGRRNASGYKGVTWSKRDRRWQAQIMRAGKQKWLGLFPTAELAHAAYCQAADALHGQFANYGASSV
ncbi:AP2 domain-containing protein [Achromobacter sp. PD1]|jgi:hypothetical protein|uniref:AP2 domain-containing protein n=1 Tax=Achromobacter sp. PD1 TaxID=3399125 RepID=UPI003AF8260F